ncbi:MAG: Ppx/GppA family phosphatase [Melioribacteraceae bacterium]|nr:Ppx/GppA family phosphatase [Melioribacteraceae bacterium]MCF8353963.1 Ppx/GppA family phosphatase [Melioribacteraceae bacterium]MCF8393691.1 Ppx/GppA family phosphatase [Melioribacteraceae bacterium]MCF8419567.1 Ppx/GppA family phosphatase [Melioribacteraceae bacterium]
MITTNNVLAAIDIGTNSFHLIVVSVTPDGNFEIIDREKEVIRLGEGSSGDIKFILSQAMDRALKTLERFKGIADSYNAVLRAVATSAVRESINKDEFLNLVRAKIGIEIEIISGIEEARLIYLGILKAVPIFNQKSLCVDIGGGSTEFVIGEKSKILYSNSIKLGAVRLTQKFFPDYKITKDRVNLCKKWIEGELSPVKRSISQIGFDTAVGSSGTINSSGYMIKTAQKSIAAGGTSLNNESFAKDDLAMLYKKIMKAKTSDERIKIKGLEQKRADIIPAGIILLSTIFEQLNIDNMLISDYALREGIIIDSIQKNDVVTENPNLHNIRMDSVKHIAEISNFDRDHCAHVAVLALKLFDQMQSLHNLGNEAREYLEAAARLHDIGYHIAHSQHHKHSSYIIMHGELLGFNENEKLIIANVARYHRKSHPKSRHNDFNRLSDQSKDIVKKISAILRIADALDRTHSKKVKDISLVKSDDKILLELDVEGEIPEIEIWSFERRKELFEEIYKTKIYAG